jgi:PAS domain-containing protein
MSIRSIWNGARVAFSTAAEGLVLVDRTGTVRMNNPRLLEMFGYEEGICSAVPSICFCRRASAPRTWHNGPTTMPGPPNATWGEGVN